MQARTINWSRLSLSILLVVILLVVGCSSPTTPTATTTTGPITTVKPTEAIPVTVTSRPHPPVRTGDIKTGTKVSAVAQPVSAAGGMVSFSKPGDPLDGFVINVPPNSYTGSNTFNVSYAPITSQTFGSDITPISPMISVDNGGTYSSNMMFIRVPVKVPADSFAMGFYYDATTKQLEGMPLLSSDADSITVGAMHFTDFFISMIAKALLKKDIDSGFRPGIDDWQFTNRGSYIASGGHCEGQSLSALWYYTTQPDGKDLCLYGRYDNNGNQPATPNLWEDDSLGYRFASVVQDDVDSSFANNFWLNMGGKNWILDNNNKWKMVDVAGISNEMTWYLFAYSIQATHEPQLVVIWSNSGGGHAMICYRIFQGNLYIADPNYPGNLDRRIEYAKEKFKPYNSGANKEDIDAGKGKAYENIMYYAKSTAVPWAKIAQRWMQFKNKTIGNDKFPAYRIVYVDEKGNLNDLNDGFVSSVKSLRMGAASPQGSAVPGLSFHLFRDGIALDSSKNVELNPDTNKIGVAVFGEVDKTDKNGNPIKVDKYIDFKYVNVVYGASTLLSALQKYTTWGSSVFVAGMKTESSVPTTYASQISTTVSVNGITWSGTSFSGTWKPTTGTQAGTTQTVNGTVSPDGKILVNLTATFDWPNYNGEHRSYSYVLNNIPIKWGDNSTAEQGGGLYSSYKSAGLSTYVSKLEYTSIIKTSTTTFGPIDWSDTTNGLNFSFGK